MIFRALIVFLVIFPLKGSCEEELSQNTVKLLSLLDDYETLYQDRTNDISVLISQFSADLLSEYETDLKTKSRFLANRIAFVLDAPIQIQKNRSVATYDCDKLSINASICAIITGEVERPRQAQPPKVVSYVYMPWRVIVGYSKAKEGNYLISFVMEASSTDTSVFIQSWPKLPTDEDLANAGFAK